jgi:hypothetical protein
LKKVEKLFKNGNNNLTTERQGNSIPCDSINTMGINLGKVDSTLLFDALKALDLAPYINGDTIYFQGGTYNKTTKEATFRQSRMSGLNLTADEMTAQVKRAYSAEVVKTTAKKYGWTLKETAPYQYQVIKRSY